MDRFVVKEPRVGADYPQGNEMIEFPANAGRSNMVPEIMYFSGPFTSKYLNVEHASHGVIHAPRNINTQHNIHNTNQLYNTNSHNTNPQYNTTPLHNMNPPRDMNNQHSMSVQHNMNNPHNMNSQHGVNHQHGMNPQMAQDQAFGLNCMPVQGHVSGIDPRYLAGYNDNSAQFIMNGQQIQRNATPINSSFGNDYQNRSFNGIDRSKQKSFGSLAVSKEPTRVESMPRPQQHQTVAQDFKNIKKPQQNNISKFCLKHVLNIVRRLLDNVAFYSLWYDPPRAIQAASQKKPNELDLLKNDIQNQIVTRADKLKALHKCGPRAFSGPVENVLKWHKSLQDIGVLIFYEIVAKCVSVRSGASCAKNLVIRDDNGPAMQIVYYEIDFMLPDLKPPCTIRVIGRMVAGTCRLQAFNVRLATGDDVATLPRRAAVAAHHVAKLCKEYGPNAPVA